MEAESADIINTSILRWYKKQEAGFYCSVQTNLGVE